MTFKILKSFCNYHGINSKVFITKKNNKYCNSKKKTNKSKYRNKKKLIKEEKSK